MSDQRIISPKPGDGSPTENNIEPSDVNGISGRLGPTRMQNAQPGFLPLSYACDRYPFEGYEHINALQSQGPMEQWYRSDGPWHPPQLVSPESNGDNRQLTGFNPGFSYVGGQYRDPVPSECDTIPGAVPPSDSGYVSNGAKQSIATDSVYGEPLDQSQESQALINPFVNLHFQGYTHNVLSGGWSSLQMPPPSSQRSNHMEGKELRCDTCNKSLKTNSELKKHQQRHSKPHKCDVPGCDRQEGFSTTNDLDRHKRSRHAEVTAGTFYRCTLSTCKNKEKSWPRADNFRAHLKRCHQKDEEADLEPFVVRSLAPSSDVDTSVMKQTEDGDSHELCKIGKDIRITSSELNSTGQVPESFSNDAPFRSQAIHAHPSKNRNAECNNPDTLIQNVSLTEAQYRATASSEAATHSFVVQGQGSRLLESSSAAISSDITSQAPYVTLQELKQNPETPLYSLSPKARHVSEGNVEQKESIAFQSSQGGLMATRPPQRRNATPSERMSKDLGTSESSNQLDLCKDDCTEAASALPAAVDLNDPDKVRELVETLQKKGLLEGLGYKKATSLDFQCEECEKSFARPCELRKHMKRHNRPYKCTFPQCSKWFGSMSDWKRHENSQHFLLELWKCNEKTRDGPSKTCGEVRHRREQFRAHLMQDHELPDDIIEKKLESCRLGRNFENRFWCGFCEEILEITRKGLEAIAERYTHLEDHLKGRHGLKKTNFNAWVDVDPDSQREDPGESDHRCENCVYPSSGSPDLNKAATGKCRGGEQPSNVSGLKRRLDDTETPRPNKRTKQTQTTIKMAICCQCGEANRRPTNPKCVKPECQHVLCRNCK